ncbi:MAG: ROK family protein [Candidatus Babeliales bacterium]|jgi:predicted NBD/HSP70 family sugar kinase
MSIFYFNLLNGYKKLGIALFLVGVLFSDLQSFRYNGQRKHKNSEKRVFLCGKSLEKAYADAIAFNSSGFKSLSAYEIIEYSKNAYDKKDEERVLEERIALKLVTSATKHLAKKIVRESSGAISDDKKVLIFGGILQGGGDFLKELLLRYVNQFNSSGKKIKIIFSEMGDERAILGAVKYAESKLNSCKRLNGQYAIGLDIGGTSIRIGLVDLEKYSLVGELVKQPVFVNNDDKNRLYFFKNQIKSALKINKKNKNFEPSELSFFLKNRSAQIEYELLTDQMIDRISDLIEGLKKDFNIKFVAIASAGTINENGFCLYAYNLPFTCVDIKQRVENIIQVPVYVANDMYCAALGEKNFGVLKSVNEFVIIGLGTGLGFKKFNFN